MKITKKKRDEAITRPPESPGVPTPGPFENPITLGTLILVMALMAIGFVMSFHLTLKSVFWGVVLATTGAALWYCGVKEHKPADPKEVGVITLWDNPLNFNWFRGVPFLGNLSEKHPDYILVSGTVILANYFPFYLDTITVDVGNKNEKFTFSLMSQDKVVVEGTLFVTARPDLCDLKDYIQAGNSMKRVFDQIASIGSKAAQEIAKDNDIEKIYFEREVVSNILEGQIRDLFETKDFGVKIIKANLELKFPREVQDKLQQLYIERLEKPREIANAETWDAVAIKMQRDAAKQYLSAEFSDNKNIPDSRWNEEIKNLIAQRRVRTLDEYRELVKQQRLVEQGKVTRIEGPQGGLNVNNIHI